ncbi:MAG: hypothetical protein ACXWF8_04755 [Methylobacter sp.]
MPDSRKQIANILNDSSLTLHFQPIVEKILGYEAYIYRISDSTPTRPRPAEFNKGAMFRLLNRYIVNAYPVTIEPTERKFGDSYKTKRASAKSNPQQLAFTANSGQAVNIPDASHD